MSVNHDFIRQRSKLLWPLRKQSKKYTKKKPTLDDGGETPITIGGGGGTPEIPLPLKIVINPKDWNENPPGTFTLIGGFVKEST